MRRAVLVFAVVVCAALSPAVASARMSIGLQNDDAMVQAGPDATTAYLRRADDLGASWVRLSVMDGLWNGGQADAYVAAARAAHDSGHRVIVSLLAWDTHPTAQEWAPFAKLVVARLAPYVDAWSPMNEPNQPNMAPATSRPCVPLSGRKLKRVRVIRYRRVKRHHGHWRRVVRHRHHKRAVRYKHVRHGHYRRVVKHVLKPKGRKATAFDWCSPRVLGRAYRKVWNWTAPAIHTLDPSATLVTGDLEPVGGPEFMRAFLHGRLAIRPDVLAIHPYELGYGPSVHKRDGSWRAHDIEEAHRWARRHHLPLWADEWGLWPSANPAEWGAWLDRFQRARVAVTILYDTAGGWWDTQMRPDAFAAVRGWRGR